MFYILNITLRPRAHAHTRARARAPMAFARRALFVRRVFIFIAFEAVVVTPADALYNILAIFFFPYATVVVVVGSIGIIIAIIVMINTGVVLLLSSNRYAYVVIARAPGKPAVRRVEPSSYCASRISYRRRSYYFYRKLSRPRYKRIITTTIISVYSPPLTLSLSLSLSLTRARERYKKKIIVVGRARPFRPIIKTPTSPPGARAHPGVFTKRFSTRRRREIRANVADPTAAAVYPETTRGLRIVE